MMEHKDIATKNSKQQELDEQNVSSHEKKYGPVNRRQYEKGLWIIERNRELLQALADYDNSGL